MNKAPMWTQQRVPVGAFFVSEICGINADNRRGLNVARSINDQLTGIDDQ